MRTITTVICVVITIFGSTSYIGASPKTQEALKTSLNPLTFDEQTFPQVHCMALNIYYEARSSNLADRVATADVVINRVLDSRYPDTICEVVKDGYVLGKRNCQFSWYCDGKSDDPQDEDRWVEAQTLAWAVVRWGQYRGITEGATHYHATYVNPRWAKSLQLVGRIGAHVYYRWQ
jgi:spore germination cell wall hydrolase CwlJ-like protein